MENTRDITGKFVTSFILFGIIMGIISFLLENMIPNMLDLKLGIPTMIIQTGIFIIFTLLTAKLTITAALGKKKVNKEQAEVITKSIRVLLIIVAIIIMFFNFFYCGNIYLSTKKDIENNASGDYTAMMESDKEKAQKEDKEKALKITAIYLVEKEIITIGSYIFIATYLKAKVNKNVEKEKKEE